MAEKTKIAIVGFGNVGRGVYQSIKKNPDMELGCILTRDIPRVLRDFKSYDPSFDTLNIGNAESESDIRIACGRADVAILCGGSATDIPIQGPKFVRYFHTVDSFDTHAKIPEYFAGMNRVAKENKSVSIISAGWDPGTFSVERVNGNSILPGSEKYTFWGRGVSQGHSDAIRRIPGVADAIQYTVPVQTALDLVRSGSNPKLTTRQKHIRECFVALKPGADGARVVGDIVNMPNYFLDYDTAVIFETLEQIAERKKQMPHAGFVLTSGQTGSGNKAGIEYRNHMECNPEFTGSILVACARAAHRLSLEGRTGAFTMLDLSPALLSPLSREELLKHWM